MLSAWKLTLTMMKYSSVHPRLFQPLLFVALMALTSFICRRKAAADVMDALAVPATTPLSAEALTSRLQQPQWQRVRTLSAHARLSIEGDEVAADASANLIWVRDSVLWLNVKKFGMEVARVLITPDSFFLLNRIDKTAMAIPQRDFQRRYQLPEGLRVLQHLLAAVAWLPENVAFQADIKEGMHRLSGTNGHFLMDYRVEEGTFLVRQSTFVQPAEGQWLSQTCARFQKLPRAGVVFPYFRRIELFSPERGYFRMDIDFTQIEVNVDKPFRFEIPEHYQRIQ